MAQDSGLGMLFLGQCYERGTGVARDLKRAKELYLASAERGIPQAKEELARLEGTTRGGFLKNLFGGRR